MAARFLLLVTALVTATAATDQTPRAFSLAGPHFTLVAPSNASVPPRHRATLPGSVHSALAIDPLVDDNDARYAWVPRQDWEFSRVFDVPSFRHGAAHILELHFVDALATVSLNGRALPPCDNAFVRYAADVTHAIRPANNTLRIALRSPVAASRALRAAYPVPLLDMGNGAFYPGGAIAPQFLRKDLSSWGWDWGAGVVPSGVWGPLRLVSFPVARLGRVTALVSGDPAAGFVVHVRAAVDVAAAGAGPSHHAAFSSSAVRLRLRLRLLDTTTNATIAETTTETSTTATLTLDNGDPHPQLPSRLTLDNNGDPHPQLPSRLTLDNNGDPHPQLPSRLTLSSPLAAPRDVLLWWPNGMGNQTRYPLVIDLLDDQHRIVDTAHRTIGFRTVAILERPAARGLLMELAVNNRTIYAKGANVIPIDIMQNREDPARLLAAAVRSNFNLVRVWGGGHYQSDAFYELASSLGLLVWQELMFACNEFPTSASYLQSISQNEIPDVVSRIGHHPSVALYSGNNENLFFTHRGPRNLTAYSLLYDVTVRRAVALSDPYRPWWPSSPSNGMLVDDVPSGIHIQRWGNEQDPTMGDRHYYDYGASCMDVDKLPGARFMSEYGLQSLPSLASLATQVSDLRLGSPMLERRQHHANGTAQLAAMLRRYFPPPRGAAQSLRQLSNHIYLTQLLQARCIGAWTATFRRRRDDPDHYTRGAVFWQLNDVWHAPTWSAIEYGGHEKMLHATVRRVFAPLAAVAWVDGSGSLRVWFVADDLPEEAVGEGGCELKVQAHRWSGGAAGGTRTARCELSRHASGEVYAMPIEQALDRAGLREAFVRVTLAARGMDPVHAHAFPSDALEGGFRAVALPNARVTAAVLGEVAPGEVEVEVATDAPAVGVWLEAGGGPEHLAERIDGWWSDNGMEALVRDEVRRVRFTFADGVGGARRVERLKALLRVVHLRAATDAEGDGPSAM